MRGHVRSLCTFLRRSQEFNNGTVIPLGSQHKGRPSSGILHVEIRPLGEQKLYHRLFSTHGSQCEWRSTVKVLGINLGAFGK